MPVNRKKRDKNRDFHSFIYKEIKRIQQKYGLSDDESFDLVSRKTFSQDKIPICIFSVNTLSSFQAIVKFLKENCVLSFKEIGALLNRSRYTIASSYRIAKTKLPLRYLVYSTDYDIPTKLIASRKYSVLESIVLYLKQKYKLRFTEIADIMLLNQRTVWTVYHRALRKRGFEK